MTGTLEDLLPRDKTCARHCSCWPGSCAGEVPFSPRIPRLPIPGEQPSEPRDGRGGNSDRKSKYVLSAVASCCDEFLTQLETQWTCSGPNHPPAGGVSYWHGRESIRHVAEQLLCEPRGRQLTEQQRTETQRRRGGRSRQPPALS